MTAAAPAAGAPGRAWLARAVAVLAGWRRLSWVAWRQHRTSLLVMLGLFGLPAAAMAATGLSGNWPAVLLHATTTGDNFVRQVFPVMLLYLLLLPVVTGLLLGAPLLAHEAESGLTRFAWTQGVGRVTQLIARTLFGSAGLAIMAAGLGLEFSWWAQSVLTLLNWHWAGIQFGLHPLPFAGWTVFAFCLGVTLGAVTRRTVPALVGTLAAYVTVFSLDNWRLRLYYLPPLRMTVPFGTFWNYGVIYYLRRSRIGRIFVTTGFSRPDGQPIHGKPHGPGVYLVNHVLQWATYQPASRYALFQVLEFGYLVVLSAVLVTSAVALIRRRSA